MNYESDAMTPDEMVDATYDAAHRHQPRQGARPASSTRDRDAAPRRASREARVGDGAHRRRSWTAPVAPREPALKALKDEFDRLSQSTVCEKTELNWPRYVGAAGTLRRAPVCSSRENVANLFGRDGGRPRACRVRPAHRSGPKPAVVEPEG